MRFEYQNTSNMAEAHSNKNVIKKGVLLTLNNIGDGLPKTGLFSPRPGAGVDSDNIISAFKVQFGLKQLPINAKLTDLSLGDWDHQLSKDKTSEGNADCCKCIRCQLSKYNFTDNDGIVLSFSTHGMEIHGEQCFQFIDGSFLPVSDIFHALSDEECPSLRGKTRVLILEACRGSEDKPEMKLDQGQTMAVSERPQRNDGTQDEKGSVVPQARPGRSSQAIIRRRNPKRTLPEDFIVVYPATPGRLSWRWGDGGSWLEKEIQAACTSTDPEHKEVREINFLHLLTSISRRVAALEGNVTIGTVRFSVKSAVCIEHKLRKALYFRQVIIN